MVEDVLGWEAVTTLYSQYQIPLAVLNERHIHLPLRSVVALIDGAASRLGSPAFGLQLGQNMKPKDLGLWARYAACADNLREALSRVARTVETHQTGAQFSFADDGEYAIFRYHNPLPLNFRGQHHTDHCVWPIITLVRNYLGQDWLPDWVDVDYSEISSSRALRDNAGLETRYGCQALGIAIPRSKLFKGRLHTIPTEEQVTLSDVLAGGSQNSAVQSIFVVEQLINLQLLEGEASFDGVAAQLGMSVRSIQRVLADEGTSFRRLLEITRMRRAAALLAETPDAVTVISQSLGYSEVANFTRAFRRYNGYSPSQYRSIAKRGENDPLK